MLSRFLIDIICRASKKMCSQLKTATFTDEEVNLIVSTRHRLRYWLSLAQAGVVGTPAEGELKNIIMEIVDISNKLYEWYVPPFTINRVTLSEQELQNVVNDLQRKGGLQGWLRLDSTYYTTDLGTFKKIIEWDWTDTRKYLINTFDCDKFAMYFKSRLSVDFGLNAVGVIIDYGSAHAYNIIIVKDAQGVRYYLFEPQNDSIFTYDQRDKSFYSMSYYYLLL
ncbi:MAG: hypothetical protein LM568_02945 [Desulfurococcaceae archaeon]|nr:hypothetical protein [Desulfurococcaceae archaeon]